jgi:hypothetical protein
MFPLGGYACSENQPNLRHCKIKSLIEQHVSLSHSNVFVTSRHHGNHGLYPYRTSSPLHGYDKGVTSVVITSAVVASTTTHAAALLTTCPIRRLQNLLICHECIANSTQILQSTRTYLHNLEILGYRRLIDLEISSTKQSAIKQSPFPARCHPTFLSTEMSTPLPSSNLRPRMSSPWSIIAKFCNQRSMTDSKSFACCVSHVVPAHALISISQSSAILCFSI